MTDRPKERVAREREHLRRGLWRAFQRLYALVEDAHCEHDLLVPGGFDRKDVEYLLDDARALHRTGLEALRSGGEERKDVPEVADGFQCEASCYCSRTPRERHYTDPETGDPLEGYYCDRHWSDDTGPDPQPSVTPSTETDAPETETISHKELNEMIDRHMEEYDEVFRRLTDAPGEGEEMQECRRMGHISCSENDGQCVAFPEATCSEGEARRREAMVRCSCGHERQLHGTKFQLPHKRSGGCLGPECGCLSFSPDPDEGSGEGEDLKPCPFCGSDLVSVVNWDTGDPGDDYWRAICHSCGVRPSAYPMKEIAVEKWNRRSRPEPTVEGEEPWDDGISREELAEWLSDRSKAHGEDRNHRSAFMLSYAAAVVRTEARLRERLEGERVEGWVRRGDYEVFVVTTDESGFSTDTREPATLIIHQTTEEEG